MENEICSNCGALIGQLETPEVWKDHVVCSACHARLVASEQDSPAADETQVVGSQKANGSRLPIPSSIYCHGCGSLIHSTSPACPNCGAAQGRARLMGESDKLILPAFLLCFFLGLLGLHRFYVGKAGTGIAMLLLSVITFGFGGAIWALIDMIIILTGSFRDAQGRLMTRWI